MRCFGGCSRSPSSCRRRKPATPALNSRRRPPRPTSATPRRARAPPPTARARAPAGTARAPARRRARAGSPGSASRPVPDARGEARERGGAECGRVESAPCARRERPRGRRDAGRSNPSARGRRRPARSRRLHAHASTASATWCRMPSTTARARSARVVPRLSARTAPRDARVPESGCRSPGRRGRRRRRAPPPRLRAAARRAPAPAGSAPIRANQSSRRSGRWDEALERVARARLRRHAHDASRPAGGRGGVVARLREGERACPERHLRRAGPRSSAGRTATPAGPPPTARTGTPAMEASIPIRVHDRREQRSRDAEQLEQLFVPVPARRAGTAASARRCRRR